jgi:zinc transport system ATP-binding protein
VKENRKLKLLDQMGILEILNENINSLSGGQLQRVFIVKAMLNFPKLLILDEPTASIDKKNVEYFYQTVNALNSEGTTVILITHDEYLDCYNYSHVLQMNTDLTYQFRKRGQTELTEVR